jgi:carbon storage regulator CsrA
MLILSRKMGESICLPGTNTTITVHRTSGGRVTLAIDAPQEVAILRGELMPIEPGSSMTLDVSQEPPVATKPR